MSEEKCDEINLLTKSIINHLSDIHSDDYPWTLQQSIVGGRGVFASRDIETHEIIFQEKPLILGQRANRNEKIICVVCYKIVNLTNVCNQNCSLPICDLCQNSKPHQEECALIRSMWPSHPTTISFNILRSLTYIRAMLLTKEQKELLYLLQGNQTVAQEEEISILMKLFKNFPSDEETRNLLKFTSAVFTTNAFETMTGPEENNNVSLRGLYPLSGLINHNCTPNTRYSFNKEHIITFKAMRPIKKNEEIFNSYTKLLFATPFRRILLAKSKNFMCCCERCTDPTERGTYISSIRCIKSICTGKLIQVDPLNFSSMWTCTECKQQHDFKKMLRIQNIMTSFFATKIESDTIENILVFLRSPILRSLPSANQFVLELKLFTVWQVGNEVEKEFNIEDFLDKERYSLEVIDVLDKLKLKNSTLSGKLYFELYKCRNKLHSLKQITTLPDIDLLKRSYSILGDSITAPQDLQIIYNQAIL